jgi:hypothetical protein
MPAATPVETSRRGDGGRLPAISPMRPTVRGVTVEADTEPA